MKRIAILLAILITMSLSAELFAQGQTQVDPYFRKDGTYVPGHYRTNPDNSIMNNWSTKGNVNPYTGEKGYVDPFNQPSTPRNSYNPYGGGTRQKNSW